MGVVFRARRVGTQPVVALKMLPGGALADGIALSRFRAEVEAAAALEHPAIVPIYDVGEHDGAPFFTMKLMIGGTLADQLPALHLDRQRAGALMARAARAVHHGHLRGILHRDLKPANLLLDAEGEVHVADFGIAKHLERTSGLTETGAVLGTPAYMAPEQARGEARSVTVAADVYSLGAIFFELLTGQPPFSAATREQLLHRVQEQDPPRPRSLDPSIPRPWETVCLQCLEKEPARRYPSAEALANDLDRLVRGEQPVAPAIGPARRLWRWARRRPGWLGLSAALTLFGASAAGVVLHESNDQKETLRRDVLAANKFAARAVAAAVELELRADQRRVEVAASDPRVAAFLDAGGETDATELLRSLSGPSCQGRFDNWELLDARGAVRGRCPAAPDQLGRRFEWRDYFRGAIALPRGVYVSRALESVVDQRIKFSLSAPVRDAEGRLLGVLSGMVATDSTLGVLHFNDPEDATRTAALIAPRDRDAAHADLPSSWVVVVHDGLARGQPVAISSPAVQHGSWSAAEYRDPVPGFDQGRWLAGFAPVAETGLLVVVQTRDVPRPSPAAVVLEVGALLAICGLVGLAVGAMARRKRHG